MIFSLKSRAVLALECTAHTFGASVVDTHYYVHSNVKDVLTDEKGGLIPVKLTEHHINYAYSTIQRALYNAQMNISDISYIAVSNSPGMGHALRTGNIIAKTISMKHKKPLIPVNHSLAHLTSAMVDANDRNTTLMYAAGANTQIYNYSDKKMMLVGETLDIGIGHLLDITARELDFGFPGGPVIEKLAKENTEETLIELPYNVKGMDIVFGGMSTKVRNIINKKNSRGELDDSYIRRICYSMQEYSFAALLEATERAAALNKSENIAIIGGVALNKRFQEMAMLLCSERSARLIIPEKSLLSDNAAMIGLEAVRLIRSKSIAAEPFSKAKSLKIKPYERLGNNFEYQLLKKGLRKRSK